MLFRSVIVEEAPTARAVMHRHLPIFEPETFYTMCSGGLGHSMPAAVGVALARPDKKVIALIGDGSAMYAIQALRSAAQLKLPITFIILKNRRYAALREFAAVLATHPRTRWPAPNCPTSTSSPWPPATA